MLLRAETFMAGIVRQGHPTPRSGLGGSTAVVVAAAPPWSKKAVIFRNAPYTIEKPHLGQAETRYRFGEIAKGAKGCKGFENGLPCVAARVQASMSGFVAEHRLPPEAYPSRVKRTYHTMEELRALIERRLRGAPKGMGAHYGIPPGLGMG